MFTPKGEAFEVRNRTFVQNQGWKEIEPDWPALIRIVSLSRALSRHRPLIAEAAGWSPKDGSATAPFRPLKCRRGRARLLLALQIPLISSPIG